MAVRTLWKFVVGRAKKLFKNYNVLERAEKVMETGKSAPPRHPGTEAKFKVLIKESQDIRADMEKRPAELLDRLKVLKVSSEGDNPKEEMNKRPLPKVRTVYEMPTYGYEDPKSVAEGKCSLGQALEFITKHQNDPLNHSIPSIATMYKMKPSDVEQVINNFRAYQLYVNKNTKLGFTKKAAKALGANKITQALYDPKFSYMEKKEESGESDEKK